MSEAPQTGLPDLPGVTLRPLVHVPDMHTAVVFYEALGARVVTGSHDGDHVLLDVGGSALSLLAHPPNPEQDAGTVELTFEAADLDTVAQRLAGVVEIVAPPSDTGFGRQLQVRAPGGLLVKISETDLDRA